MPENISFDVAAIVIKDGILQPEKLEGDRQRFCPQNSVP